MKTLWPASSPKSPLAPSAASGKGQPLADGRAKHSITPNTDTKDVKTEVRRAGSIDLRLPQPALRL
ncbi:hypothetical protein AA18895_1433 [Acetobacter ghanensis DSM 18895]|nr:hypothetical protein AA18895_1433 [Acetobacter ghanensis DSM 18895]